MFYILFELVETLKCEIKAIVLGQDVLLTAGARQANRAWISRSTHLKPVQEATFGARYLLVISDFCSN
jgi:hypothetical protein